MVINAFHLLHAYLFPTENWCYQIIRNLPDTNVYIVSENLRSETAFPLPEARFLVHPFPRDTSNLAWPLKAGVGLARRFASRVWFPYLGWRARQADVFHAHFATMGWQYLSLAESVGRPLVVSFYGYDYEWIPRNRPEWRERYRILFEKAELFLTEGEAGKAKLVKAGCPADKIRVAHLGVDVGRIPFLLRGKTERELKLVQVATFTPKKGQETTVRAFLAAAPRCPGMTLTFVGKDGEGLRPPLQRLVAEAGLGERVRFLDFVSFDQLHRFLHEFHAFVHPSRHSDSGDSEGGAPIVLLDAQATGMPVLATRHCDIPEEVLEGKTGLLVDEGDHAALAEAMCQLYDMGPERYAAFAQAARRHVEERYDVTTCARRVRDFYDEAIARHRGRADGSSR